MMTDAGLMLPEPARTLRRTARDRNESVCGRRREQGVHDNHLKRCAFAIDTVLAAGKEFGLPVAMTITTDMMERIEQGARLFTGGVTPALRREAGR